MTGRSAYVVIDTNILFSALLVPSSKFAATILNETECIFVVGETVITELFEHKERIVKISKLSSEDIITAYHALLRHLTIYKETLISAANWQQAIHLCQDVDADDTAHVALTLETQGQLWTSDRRLKNGLQAKGFTYFFTPVA
jgi:predicted nucleic acid-binding protein